MLKHSVIIAIVAFIYMGLYGHELPSLPPKYEFNLKMAKHSAIIGLISFLYMGAFGHALPFKLNGPFFKK
ncbi:hypothetical protein COU54_01410 [Candidatus Pacearchaeota archaeon CG10_big_fil_rev_8_21_14_0_10_31_24]|nr:MAG: hypothetical protein COU54_01410 [Candidatus Pacearchaeota archaeon CG10_big_fil_rev_8_21_14_0_10_31_24]